MKVKKDVIEQVRLCWTLSNRVTNVLRDKANEAHKRQLYQYEDELRTQAVGAQKVSSALYDELTRLENQR